MDEQKLEKSFKGPIPNSLSHAHKEGFHLVTTCAANPNEPGSITANLELFKHFVSKRVPFEGRWTLVIKHHELNTNDKKKLSNIIANANLLIDFRQTQAATLIPFYHTKYHFESCMLAQTLGYITTMVVKPPTIKTGTTFNELAISNGIPSLEVYVGPKGSNKLSHEYTFEVLNRILKINKFDDKLKSSEKMPISVFEYKHLEKYKKSMQLKRFKNFDPIQAKEVIGSIDGADLIAPQDGVILFPQYVKDAGLSPEYLYILLDAVSKPLEEHYGSMTF